jgi:hypothetical protein
VAHSVCISVGGLLGGPIGCPLGSLTGGPLGGQLGGLSIGPLVSSNILVLNVIYFASDVNYFNSSLLFCCLLASFWFVCLWSVRDMKL